MILENIKYKKAYFSKNLKIFGIMEIMLRERIMGIILSMEDQMQH